MKRMEKGQCFKRNWKIPRVDKHESIAQQIIMHPK